MSTRSRHHVSAIATIAATLSLLSFALVAPASATPVTFTIESGALVITAPTANAALGKVSTSSSDQSVSGALGTVSVSDNRSPAVIGWVATVISSDFTGKVGSTTTGTVAAKNVGYTTGTITPGGTASSANFTGYTPVDISASQNAAVATNLTGANTASWPATITVAIPGSTPAGTYTGTITHSAA